MGFRVYKIWQILKHFAGTFRQAQTLKLGEVNILIKRMLRFTSVGWVTLKGNNVWKGGDRTKVNKFLLDSLQHVITNVVFCIKKFEASKISNLFLKSNTNCIQFAIAKKNNF